MRRILGLLILILLTACGSVPKKPAPTTEIVELPVRQFRVIDPELTKPCGPKAEGRISEIFEVSKLRGMQVDDCDLRMKKIRNLQPLTAEPQEKPAD